MWTVVLHPEAEAELDALPLKERIAVMHAVEKLVAVGPEALVDVRGFRRAVAAATKRLDEVEE